MFANNPSSSTPSTGYVLLSFAVFFTVAEPEKLPRLRARAFYTKRGTGEMMRRMSATSSTSKSPDASQGATEVREQLPDWEDERNGGQGEAEGKSVNITITLLLCCATSGPSWRARLEHGRTGSENTFVSAGWSSVPLQTSEIEASSWLPSHRVHGVHQRLAATETLLFPPLTPSTSRCSVMTMEPHPFSCASIHTPGRGDPSHPELEEPHTIFDSEALIKRRSRDMRKPTRHMRCC